MKNKGFIKFSFNKLCIICMAFLLAFEPLGVFAENVSTQDTGTVPEVSENTISEVVDKDLISENDIVEEINSSLTGMWKGDYDGFLGSTNVKRSIRLDIDSSDADGNFEGVASVDDGKNGIYFFTGNVDSEKKVTFAGVKWIVNPSNFSFAAFTGTLDEDEMVISGTIDGNDQKTFQLTKKSNDYKDYHVNKDEIPKEWVGEYDGHAKFSRGEKRL